MCGALSSSTVLLLWCGRDLCVGIFAEVKPGRNAIGGFFSITNIKPEKHLRETEMNQDAIH